MLHHFSSYLKGRWEERTLVIRTLDNRWKLKKEGRGKKKTGGEEEEKEGHRRVG